MIKFFLISTSPKYFITLKYDTPLPPVNRTSEIEHHGGWKKEIYQDVWFFHGALQFIKTWYQNFNIYLSALDHIRNYKSDINEHFNIYKQWSEYDFLHCQQTKHNFNSAIKCRPVKATKAHNAADRGGQASKWLNAKFSRYVANFCM